MSRKKRVRKAKQARRRESPRAVAPRLALVALETAVSKHPFDVFCTNLAFDLITDKIEKRDTTIFERLQETAEKTVKQCNLVAKEESETT